MPTLQSQTHLVHSPKYSNVPPEFQLKDFWCLSQNLSRMPFKIKNTIISFPYTILQSRDFSSEREEWGHRKGRWIESKIENQQPGFTPAILGNGGEQQVAKEMEARSLWPGTHTFCLTLTPSVSCAGFFHRMQLSSADSPSSWHFQHPQVFNWSLNFICTDLRGSTQDPGISS